MGYKNLEALSGNHQSICLWNGSVTHHVLYIKETFYVRDLLSCMYFLEQTLLEISALLKLPGD